MQDEIVVAPDAALGWHSLVPNQNASTEIWYKEAWVWFVIAGPSLVVIACLWTAYLAIHGADQVVAKDYYRQGLMINTDLQRDARAQQMQLKGALHWNLDSSKISLQLSANARLPQQVRLSLAGSGADSGGVEELVRRLVLQQGSPGIYEVDLSASLGQLEFEKLNQVKLLHLKLETDEWRLTKDWQAKDRARLNLP